MHIRTYVHLYVRTYVHTYKHIKTYKNTYTYFHYSKDTMTIKTSTCTLLAKVIIVVTFDLFLNYLVSTIITFVTRQQLNFPSLKRRKPECYGMLCIVLEWVYTVHIKHQIWNVMYSIGMGLYSPHQTPDMECYV